MKILIAHNHYQHAGGEDGVVANEHKLLIEQGHEVMFWSVNNKDLTLSLTGKIKTALTTSYSVASRESARDLLGGFKPDVVHAHNFFPQLSPSIYDACIDEGVPVVQTLHNYRLICPGALLMRDGRICEQCVSGSPYQAVLYGCYRGSKLGSLVVAHMVDKHRKQGTWQHKVNWFVALTNFARDKFIEAGFPADKISVKPNFVTEVKAVIRKNQAQAYALFVGRVSLEKGIKTLIESWRQLNGAVPLRIAGSGELANQLGGINAVKYLGFQSAEDVDALMREAKFLVMPSEWYEGFPMVLVEAFSRGLPVLASRLGGMAEIVEDGVTGLLFEPGNAHELAEKARWLINHPDECMRMGNNARATYLEKYTPEINYNQLKAIYLAAMA
ncbi:glycosyltransferase [Methylomonas sp. LW13]|uniref:glycosyltransferase family 4 protein n=1 Tax=unclassified Methylomonas TaxID=2608980 RepID=UPI00051B8C0B|nr:glycosyltransferase family 4 protein [Methylomonas sp. LW13]QBC25695.1 glycosyltransferase [Methylomonas sp. LW13]